MTKKIIIILTLTLGIVFVAVLLRDKPQPQILPTTSPAVTELPEVVFNIEPPVKAVRAGENFKIDIYLQSKEEVLAVDLDLNYDPQALELEKIEAGSFFNSPMEFSKSIDESQGKIFYALGSLSPMSGKGNVASLTFKSKIAGEHVKINFGDKTLVSVKGEKEVRLILPEK